MRQALIILISIISLQINAQSWQWSHHIGGKGFDNASISYIDSANNIYLFGRYAEDWSPPYTYAHDCYIGNDTLFGTNASFIAKYNSEGTLLWVKNIYSPVEKDASLIDMEYDSVSNHLFLLGSYSDTITVGSCGLSNPYGTFLGKMDLEGNCIWLKDIGTTGGSSMTFDNQGNIYLAGLTHHPYPVIDSCSFSPGTYIAKLTPEGSCLWVKTKVADGVPYYEIQKIKYSNEKLYALGYVSADNSILTIDTININIPCHYCWGIGILCMDDQGTAKWMNVDGLPESFVAMNSLAIDKQGNILCLGWTIDTCIFGNDTVISKNLDWIVLEYNKSGNLTNTNHIKISDFNYNGVSSCPGIYASNDQSYYVTAGFKGFIILNNDTVDAYNETDFFIARYNYSGECLGFDHFGGCVGGSIALDYSGVYMTGAFPPFPTVTGSVTVGNNTYETYGYEDIIFAKHDLMTGIPEIKGGENNSLVIYANPNKGSFRVKLPDEFKHEKSLSLVVYDNLGKVIKSQSLSLTGDQPSVDIFGQKAGTYFITISNGKSTYSGKLIIQ